MKSGSALLRFLRVLFNVLVVCVLASGLVSAQTVPPLGAASTFAILGGSTVTATGVDTISGNIGVSPGTAITGFPPGVILNGAMYSGAGTLAEQAQASATTAFNYLAGESYPAANDLSGKTLGASPGAIVLTPGVYHFGAATTLDGKLTLNDGGNPNAIFIIQIGSALTTGANSSVVMTSGGVGKNVYWQIGSSATFGAGTAFCGNLIALTAITMNPGAFTTGRVFALNAAVTVNGTVIQAVSKTWTGLAGTRNWGDANNWNAAGVPTATDNVDLTSADTININVVAICKNLFVYNDSLQLTVNSGQSLAVTKIFRLTKGTIINGGNLIIYGPIMDSAAVIASTGTVTINHSLADTLIGKMFKSNTTFNLVINNSNGTILSSQVNILGVLRLSAGTLTTAGYLTLASNAGSTGLYDATSPGTLSGITTMQRYLTAGFGYKYISSPCQAATVQSLATVVNLAAPAFPNLYSYSENTAATGWAVDTVSTNVLVPMQGYAANFGPATAPKLISITGQINLGTVSIALTNTNQAITQGFNLVGNPYPAPINWNAPTGWTRTNIDNAIYFFDTGTTDQYSGTYSTFVNGISSNGIADSIIASIQGFFVHVTNGSYPVSGTLGATTAVMTDRVAPVFHRSGLTMNRAVRQLLRIGANYQGSKITDALVAYTDQRASMKFNKELDAVKLMNSSAAYPEIYLLNEKHEKLVIKAVSDFAAAGDIPLGLVMSRDGEVKLSLIGDDRLPPYLHVFLNDQLTGKSHDLQAQNGLVFSLKKGVYDQRFSLSCRTVSQLARIR